MLKHCEVLECVKWFPERQMCIYKVGIINFVSGDFFVCFELICLYECERL